jgi:hypothetical protein
MSFTFTPFAPACGNAGRRIILARIDELGGVPLPMSPEEFGKLVAGEIEKMGKVIKAAGISVK